MDVDRTIHQMIERYSDRHRDHIAVIEEQSYYRYDELNKKANQLSHYLKQLDLQADTIIAFALDRSSQLLTTLLAILKSGCAYLPLDVQYPKERLEYILNDAKTPIVITHSTLEYQFTHFSGHLILIDQIWHELNTMSTDNPSTRVTENNLAYVIYTSGSTGKPKGVLIEHRSVTNYIHWFKQYSGCKQQDRIDFSSNINFDMAVTSTSAALALGLQLVICDDAIKKNVNQYLLYLAEKQINISKITPSYFKMLIQEALHQSVPLPNLNAIILGGEILHTKDCSDWLQIYREHQLFNEYGPTETTVAVTAFCVNSNNISKCGPIVPIGKAGLNIECRIVQDEKEIRAQDEIGELVIGGVCLARGYLNQEQATKEKFVTNPFPSEAQSRWYRTGDYCKYLSDNNIEFIKRIDEQIKIRGYRIEPYEIEASLSKHPLIKSSCVIASENAVNEQQLIAYYITKNNETVLNNQSLRLFLQDQLPTYMIPSLFIKIASFPLTENGKLDKKALPKPIFETRKEHATSRLEQKLTAIWKKAFSLDNIDIHHHFFELGGHSLIACKIIVDIEKTLGKKIQLETFYKAPTIHQLAKVLAVSKKIKAKKSTIAEYDDETNNLSDFQFVFWLSHFFEPKIKKLNIIARRRVAGKLDIRYLEKALQFVMNKHEILGSRICNYYPAYKKGQFDIHIKPHDLTQHSEKEIESILSNELDALINLPLWKINRPLLEIKLFYLSDSVSELQLSVSHIIFDDASVELFLNELSDAYLFFQSKQPITRENDETGYNRYVLHERNTLNQNLHRDISFWKSYLHDTSLVKFKNDDVIHDMKNIPYSSYLEIPEETIKNTSLVCTKIFVTLMDLISAAVTFSLKKIASDANDHIYINIIRSIREDDRYDKIIGCFLRLDPIKVDLKTRLSYIELAISIQKSRIKTMPYQACSGMVKLACLDKSYREKSLQNILLNMLARAYCRIFRNLKLQPTMLMMYSRLKTLRTKQNFLININLLNNFISTNKNENLFGFNVQNTEIHPYDLSTIDNVLDICFFRDSSHDKMYLVISSNLKPELREEIGNEIIRQMNVDVDALTHA